MNRGRSGFGSERQLDDEARAYGTVLFDADGTMMIFDDAAYDCEAEAGAAFLGREIGEEQFLFELLRDAVARVGDQDFDRIAAGKGWC